MRQRAASAHFKLTLLIPGEERLLKRSLLLASILTVAVGIGYVVRRFSLIRVEVGKTGDCDGVPSLAKSEQTTSAPVLISVIA